MKFSVLLPTRNRLEYLKHAVSSVQQQDYANWEIIIYDNDSEEDIQGFVQSLGDSRIQYFRTDCFCSVTENWNNAMAKCSGDYVVMLGDDDCLLSGYFSLCLSLLDQFKFPDLIYNSALSFFYPKVVEGSPEGSLLKCTYASFLVDKETPYILDKTEAQRIVQEVMNFNVSVNFNMQHSLVSRKLILEMQNYGEFFQSPYPDYYATTALFLKAERILIVPYAMVVIGVTPKSFGFYYVNNKEDQGVEFLNNMAQDPTYKSISKYVISGTKMNICWLFSMESVRRNFAHEYPLSVNYKKFRFLQVLQQYKKFANHEGPNLWDMIRFLRSLFAWEIVAYFVPFLIALYIRLRPKNDQRRTWAYCIAMKYSHPAHGPAKTIPGQYTNIMDVFQQIKIDC